MLASDYYTHKLLSYEYNKSNSLQIQVFFYFQATGTVNEPPTCHPGSLDEKIQARIRKYENGGF